MVYSTYVDAKNPLNQLRQSRGFFPVVAVADRKGQMPLVATSPTNSSPKGPSKGKGGKKSGKGQFRSSPGKGKGPMPKARAKAAMQQGCLRCGRADHVVGNCPHVSGNGSKRKVVDLDADSLIGMVFLEGAEQFHGIDEAYHQGESLVKAGGWLSQQPDMCVQDQGASSFITRTEYLLRYLKWLETSGYPMAELSFKRCDKGFAFGGDASGHGRWMVELPVFISGNSGRLQAYVIFGATPMLLGRPILERLQVDVSFGTGRMRILGLSGKRFLVASKIACCCGWPMA